MDYKIHKQKKRRFSEIVPTFPILFVLFRAIRLVFGEAGRVAQWTRGWRCEWKAEILMEENKGRIMVSRNRQALIDWEHEIFCKPKFKL